MLIISIIIVWFFSKKITKPILELANISQRMADLDFDAKYTSGGRNEIASCRFVKYLMPKNTYYNTHATRTRTRVVAGLECSITYDTRMEKRKRTGRHRRPKGV